MERGVGKRKRGLRAQETPPPSAALPDLKLRTKAQ